MSCMNPVTYVSVHFCAYIYVYINVYVHFSSRIDVCMRTNVKYMSLFMYTQYHNDYVYLFMCVMIRPDVSNWCVYACAYTYAYEYMCVCVHIYLYLHVYTYMYLYIYIYICMSIYTRMLTTYEYI